MKTDRKPAKANPAADHQRDIQRQQEARDQHPGGTPQQGGEKKAVQAGARAQPDRMPAQHVAKPGHESELDLKPRFLAPDYRGSGKLEGMSAIITGADSGIGRAVDDAVRTFGKLDILVNNAAFQEHAASLEDITDERLEETLHTNVLGYFHMAKAALPHLKPGSSIINTGSVTGLEGSRHLLDYSATKGAIHAFTKSLASDLLDKGIRVNAVAPGPVWTPLNPADAPAEQVAKFGADTDMKRPAQPEELSPAYVFLAAPVCSGYISGIVLPVTGSVGAI